MMPERAGVHGLCHIGSLEVEKVSSVRPGAAVAKAWTNRVRSQWPGIAAFHCADVRSR